MLFLEALRFHLSPGDGGPDRNRPVDDSIATATRQRSSRKPPVLTEVVDWLDRLDVITGRQPWDNAGSDHPLA